MFTRWWTGNSLKPNPSIRRIFISAMCAATLTVSGCALLPDEPEEEVLPEIKPPVISQKPTYEVRLETIETRVSANGRIMSTREENVFFTEDDKRLKELYVRPGDMVEVGQVVAELDVSDMEKMLRERRLQFRRDEVEMKMTLRNRDQMDPIQFEEAKIAFEQKLQEIEDLEETIANAKLVAPFAGTVVSIHVEKGALVKAYDPILTIADVDNLAVAVSLTKDDLNKVAPGMEAVVSIGTIGTYSGKVKQLPVASDGDQGGGGFPQTGDSDSLDKYLIIELDEFPEDATRGMPLNVSIITQRKENCVVIPLAALRTIGSRTYVQVMEEDGTKREVDVEIGQQTSTDVEIVKGLQPGQKVVGR